MRPSLIALPATITNSPSKILLTLINISCYDFDMITRHKIKFRFILLLSALIPAIFLFSCGDEGSSFSETSDTTDLELTDCPNWCDALMDLCPTNGDDALTQCLTICQDKLDAIEPACPNGLNLDGFNACADLAYDCNTLTVGCFDAVTCDQNPND